MSKPQRRALLSRVWQRFNDGLVLRAEEGMSAGASIAVRHSPLSDRALPIPLSRTRSRGVSRRAAGIARNALGMRSRSGRRAHEPSKPFAARLRRVRRRRCRRPRRLRATMRREVAIRTPDSAFVPEGPFVAIGNAGLEAGSRRHGADTSLSLSGPRLSNGVGSRCEFRSARMRHHVRA